MKYLKDFSSQGEYDMYRAVLPFPTLCGVGLGAEFAKLAPIPKDEIWYTSDDGSAVSPGTNSFGSGITVVSNTYADGKGVIKLSGNATEIGSYGFSYHGSLTSILIPDSVTSIGGGAFSGCTGLTSITIPNSVTSIGYEVFNGCTALTSINIPDGVTSIADSVFYGCTGLTSITIPDSVTSIGNYAFQGCTGLASITIPDSVTSIGRNAFKGCTGLASVTCQAATPPTLGNTAFQSTNDCPIYVPSASVDAYKAASKWSSYADRIQAIPS